MSTRLVELDNLLRHSTASVDSVGSTLSTVVHVHIYIHVQIHACVHVLQTHLHVPVNEFMNVESRSADHLKERVSNGIVFRFT